MRKWSSSWPWSSACILAAVLHGGAARGVPLVTGGGGEGVTTDLFDVAQGTAVLDGSPMSFDGGSFPQNAFGGTGGTVEPLHTLFADGPVTTVEFINFRTAAPVRLTGYTATLADDSDNAADPGDPYRGTSYFGLYTSPDATFAGLTLVSGTGLASPYVTSYGSNAVLVSDTLPDVTAQFFRVELLRASGGGPRIREIDGFGTIVPEPAGLGAALLTAGGLFGRRGRRRPSSPGLPRGKAS